jgi:hypothetical protein
MKSKPVVYRTRALACLALILVSGCIEGGASRSLTTSAWFIEPSLSNVAIITVDFSSLELKAAYFIKQEPCDKRFPPPGDQELTAPASRIFNAVGTGWTSRISKQGKELAFDVSRVGDFAVLEIPPVDFGGAAISDRCSGLVLYAGSIVWSGLGEQIYPAVPLRSDALQRKATKILPPQTIDIVIGVGANANTDSGMAAWESIANLNLVQEMASSPYTVLVYLYPRTVGMFDPAQADWIIFVHRGPPPEPSLVATATPQQLHLSPLRTPTSFVAPLPTRRP